MSHRSRRAPPIECPLASLGHNHNLATEHQYHHPLSSSPLNPNDYQMSSRKSPLLNIGADGLIQFSTIHETDDSMKSVEDVSHLSTAINHNLNDNNDYVNVYRNPLQCNLSTTGESDTASTYQQKNSIGHNAIRANNVTNDNLFDIAHKRNDRLLMRNSRTKSAINNNNYCATIDCGEPYFIEQKMRSLFLNEVNVTERNSTYPFARAQRAYDLECGNGENRLKFDKPIKFIQHPSSPSETSESDRYLIERTSQESPALEVNINRNGYNYSKNHQRISTPSNSSILIDGMTSRLGRFSPSFDQGYHTLNSPSLSATTSNNSQPMQHTRVRNKTDTIFNKLTDELCIKLFSWLDSCDLSNVSKVCKRFDSIVWRPQLWRTITLKGKMRMKSIFFTCYTSFHVLMLNRTN